MVHRDRSSATLIYRPELCLLLLTEEPAQPQLNYEAADASRPNDLVPSPSIDRRTLSDDSYGHLAEDERPNLHRDGGSIRQHKVRTPYDPC